MKPEEADITMSGVRLTVILTRQAALLLQKLPPRHIARARSGTTLERLAAEQSIPVRRMTPAEAVDRIWELRKGITLGGVTIHLESIQLMPQDAR